MVCSRGRFTKLLVLKLWKLEMLEELQVDIRSCNELKFPTWLKHLKNLRELNSWATTFLAACRSVSVRFPVPGPISRTVSVGFIWDFRTMESSTRGTQSSHGEAGTVVQGVLVLLESFSSWKVQHLKRDYNIVAHELAQIAKGSAESQTWEDVEPTMLQHLLLADRAKCKSRATTVDTDPIARPVHSVPLVSVQVQPLDVTDSRLGLQTHSDSLIRDDSQLGEGGESVHESHGLAEVQVPCFNLVPPTVQGEFLEKQLEEIDRGLSCFDTNIVVSGDVSDSGSLSGGDKVSGTRRRRVVRTVSDFVISNESGNSVNPDLVITAFWAPFLLLHLGGPDTITAYSLEDNELWRRHALTVVTQVTTTVYVVLRCWTSTPLNFLAIPIFVAGMINSGERIWVLSYVSGLQFNVPVNDPLENADILQNAYNFFKIFKQLLADVIVNFHDIENSRIIIKNVSSEDTFKMIEIELGFIYDVFHSKAVVLYSFVMDGFSGCFTLCCISLRCINFLSISSVFMAFLITEKHDYSRVYVIITYKVLCIHGLLEKHRHRYSKKVLPVHLKQVILDQLQHKLESAMYDGKKLCAYRGDWELQNAKSLDNIGRGDRDTIKGAIEVEFDESILLWHIATNLCFYSNDQEQDLDDCKDYRDTSQLLSNYMLYLLVFCPLMLPNGIGHQVS
ncbi:hypothetical protein SO802_004954 [Lithocarpus litseifolius]|uniref:DUF4220 domain-containing protein n=1 Tax=Lithocarpus litseifolius TaxID=425828 RepID=A0AAW2DMC5_9ROSI